MAPIATFLDTTSTEYTSASKALITQGWKAVRNTTSNRKTIMLKYYEYLVNTNAKLAGINPSMLTPAQLQPVWERANAEFIKYEMYVKDQATVTSNVEMGSASAPQVATEEVFITNEQRIDLAYEDINDLLSAMSGLKFGGKRRRHTKARKHTKRRKTNRRKTHKTRRHHRK
jgi:hypothetical protein